MDRLLGGIIGGWRVVPVVPWVPQTGRARDHLVDGCPARLVSIETKIDLVAAHQQPVKPSRVQTNARHRDADALPATLWTKAFGLASESWTGTGSAMLADPRALNPRAEARSAALTKDAVAIGSALPFPVTRPVPRICCGLCRSRSTSGSELRSRRISDGRRRAEQRPLPCAHSNVARWRNLRTGCIVLIHPT